MTAVGKKPLAVAVDRIRRPTRPAANRTPQPCSAAAQKAGERALPGHLQTQQGAEERSAATDGRPGQGERRRWNPNPRPESPPGRPRVRAPERHEAFSSTFQLYQQPTMIYVIPALSSFIRAKG